MKWLLGATLLLSCAAARPTPGPANTWVHVPQLAARETPAADVINQQLKLKFDEMASCEPYAAESANVDGEITLRSPRLVGAVAHVEVFCVHALHPVIENVSFFFDAVTGERLPTILKPDAEPELERRFLAKQPALECEDEHVSWSGLLLEPRTEGLWVTTNVGWANRPCAQSALLTWQDLEGLLVRPPSP